MSDRDDSEEESPEGGPVITLREPADELGAVLREAQFLILKYPIAAQALFSAFVAEGRAFVRTPEGRAWRRRLAASELVRQGRVVWEAVTQNALEETPPSVLPSQLVDVLARAVSLADLEPTLSRCFEEEDDVTGGKGSDGNAHAD